MFWVTSVFDNVGRGTRRETECPSAGCVVSVWVSVPLSSLYHGEA